jgi:hypothetical protein
LCGVCSISRDNTLSIGAEQAASREIGPERLQTITIIAGH